MYRVISQKNENVVILGMCPRTWHQLSSCCLSSPAGMEQHSPTRSTTLAWRGGRHSSKAHGAGTGNGMHVSLYMIGMHHCFFPSESIHVSCTQHLAKSFKNTCPRSCGSRHTLDPVNHPQNSLALTELPCHTSHLPESDTQG